MAKYHTMKAIKRTLFLLLFAGSTGSYLNGQKADTLHLYFHFSQLTGLPDTTSKKIDAFIAKLGGVPTDATVISYYHKSEFKKIAADRTNEVNDALRGRARVMFTLGEPTTFKVSDPDKLKVVDIIYKPTGAVEPEVKKKDNKKEDPNKAKQDEADKKAKELEQKKKELAEKQKALEKEQKDLEKDSKEIEKAKKEEEAKKKAEEDKKKKEEEAKKKEESAKVNKELSKEEQELEKAKKELEDKLKEIEKKKKEANKDVEKEKKEETDKKKKEEAKPAEKKEAEKPKKVDDKKKEDPKKETTETKPVVVAKPKEAVPFFHLDEFKKRKLLVVLLEENPEEVAKISKNAQQLEQYKQNIKKYNDNLSKAINDQWKETPFEFITETKAKALNFDENYDKVIFLLPGKKEMEQVPFLVYNISMAYVDGKDGKNDTKLYENKFKVALQNDVPSNGELSYVIEKIKTFYNLDTEFDRGELVNVLKDKRLLIDKELTSATEDEIKAVYPYSYKVTTAEEIAMLADKRAKNNVYIKVEAFNHAVNYVIIDTETGKVMSRVALSGAAKAEKNNAFGGFNCGSKITPSQTDFGYTKCAGCGMPANAEIFKLYSQKAKLTAADIKALSTEEEQEKVTPLIPY